MTHLGSCFAFLGTLVGSLLGTLALGLPAQDAARPGRAPRPKPIALHVGTIHPVAGPEIKDGVILISGVTITAIGSATDVTIPSDAEVLSFPQAHAYPGLVDAGTSLYVDGASQQDAALDAGSDLRSALDANDPDAAAVVAAGVTTAYVHSRSAAIWRGQGAIVRPRAGQIVPFRFPGAMPRGAGDPGQAATNTALDVRLSAGSTHPVDRQKALAGLGDPFDQLEGYEKSLTDWDKAVEEYKKKYSEYLAWHSARNPAGESRPASGSSAAPASRPTPASAPQTAPTRDEGGESRPTGEGPSPGQGRGNRGGRRGGGFPPQGGEGGRPIPGSQGPGSTPSQTPSAQAPLIQGSQPNNAGAGAQGAAAPAKPTWPKEPQRDLGRDALIKVKKGEMPLRIEVVKEDEVRAALKLQKDKQLKRVVLTGAIEAAGVAKEIAEQGVPVVLTGLSTGPAPVEGEDEEAGNEPRPALAKALADAGVTIAIGSGSGKAARNLTLLAANAVGMGLGEAAALRAITLSAAEVLGIARTCGSLERGKIADIVLTSDLLFRSDCRVLRVLSAGETVYESK